MYARAKMRSCAAVLEGDTNDWGVQAPPCDMGCSLTHLPTIPGFALEEQIRDEQACLAKGEVHPGAAQQPGDPKALGGADAGGVSQLNGHGLNQPACLARTP